MKNLDIDAAVLTPSGVISTFMVDDDPSHPPAVNLQRLLEKDATVHFALVYAMERVQHDRAIADLTNALALGALRPRIARRFPLERIAEAHELLGTAGAGGKVVLDVV
ncbi:zinc-binding dehydrogenase [Mycobacterium sp.]|uniref:zinc-binding dehydrogenase n=1 Tax=Mycobacterium sp. TaxID=1785 RepID=UPI003D0AD2D5